MARPFSPQAVLRHLPLALLRSFLSSASIPTNLTWDALADGDGCALHRAYTALAPNHRTTVESMLRGVHELASETGV